MPTPVDLETEAVPRVAEVLSAAARPLTLRQLKDSAHLSDDVLKSALEMATAQARAFRWPDYRRSQYFWSQSPEHAAREAVLEVSSKLALSRTKLIEQARKRVPGFSSQAMQPIVAALVAEQQLQEAGAFTAGKLLIRPGEAAAYAASARAFVEKKFRKAGLDPAACFGSPAREDKPAATASADAPELLLAAVRSLQPSEGVPVTAQRLRQRLPALSQSEFDAAALELRRNQQVFLALHHDPYSLPQPERDLLIDGGDGTFYVSIAIR